MIKTGTQTRTKTFSKNRFEIRLLAAVLVLILLCCAGMTGTVALASGKAELPNSAVSDMPEDELLALSRSASEKLWAGEVINAQEHSAILRVQALSEEGKLNLPIEESANLNDAVAFMSGNDTDGWLLADLQPADETQTDATQNDEANDVTPIEETSDLEAALLIAERAMYGERLPSADYELLVETFARLESGELQATADQMETLKKALEVATTPPPLPTAPPLDGQYAIQMEASIGWEGRFRVTCWTPVQVELQNDGAPFEGELGVLVELGDYEYIRYYTPVVLDSGAKKSIRLPILPEQVQRAFEVKLVDKNNKVAAYQQLTHLTILEPGRIMVGILTEDHDALAKLDFSKVQLSNYGKTVTAFLDETSFPESQQVLSNFRLLVVNDFALSRLSEAQRIALFAWLEAGGTMILGTGESGGKTLQGIDSEDLGFTLGSTRPMDIGPLVHSVYQNQPQSSGQIQPYASSYTSSKVSSAYRYGGGGYAVAQVAPVPGQKTESPVDEVPALDANAPEEIMTAAVISGEGQDALLIGEDALAKVFTVGSGHILVFSVDLGREPIRSWPGLAQEMGRLLRTFGGTIWNESYDPYFEQDMMNRYTNLLNMIAKKPLPSLLVIGGILLLFVLLAVPVNYLILKKLDRRELAWVTIPVLVIVFCVGLFVFGAQVKGNKPIVASLSFVRDGGEGLSTVQTYTGVVLPKRGDYEFAASNAETLRNMGKSDDYRSYYSNEYSTIERTITTQIRQDAGMTIEKPGLNVWNMYCFEQSRPVSGIGRLTADLYTEEGHIRGTVTNQSEQLLTDVLVRVGENFALIDRLEVGATAEVDIEVPKIPLSTDYYGFPERVYPYNYNLDEPMEPEREQEVSVRRDVLFSYENLMRSQVNTTMQSTDMLLGWAEEPIGDSVLVNGKNDALKYARTVYEGNINLSYEHNGALYIPADKLRGSLVSTGTNYVNADMWGVYLERGSASFVIDLAQWLEEYNIESVTLKWGMQYGTGELSILEDGSSLVLEDGLPTDAGLNAAKWKKLKVLATTTELTLTGAELQKALCEGAIWCRATVDENNQYRESLNLLYPTVEVKGRVK